MNTSVFLLTLEIFLLVAYLMVLFQVVTDLFRDTRLSGVARAVWIFFLLAVPLVTVLVYLIARGPRMALRRREAIRETERNTREYIREVAGTSPAQQIRTARELHDDGTLDRHEFEMIKAKALAG